MYYEWCDVVFAFSAGVLAAIAAVYIGAFLERSCIMRERNNIRKNYWEKHN